MFLSDVVCKLGSGRLLVFPSALTVGRLVVKIVFIIMGNYLCFLASMCIGTAVPRCSLTVMSCSGR